MTLEPYNGHESEISAPGFSGWEARELVGKPVCALSSVGPAVPAEHLNLDAAVAGTASLTSLLIRGTIISRG
jgi:hypothetical protein